MLINVFSKHVSTLRNMALVKGSAIMTRLVGTFAAGFAVTLAIALLILSKALGYFLSMVL